MNENRLGPVAALKRTEDDGLRWPGGRHVAAVVNVAGRTSPDAIQYLSKSRGDARIDATASSLQCRLAFREWPELPPNLERQ
jgi:hypothetical protein